MCKENRHVAIKTALIYIGAVLCLTTSIASAANISAQNEALYRKVLQCAAGFSKVNRDSSSRLGKIHLADVKALEKNFPNNVKVVSDVSFAYRPKSGKNSNAERDVLVISTYGLSEKEREKLSKSDLGIFKGSAVSMWIKPKEWLEGGHMRVRYGNQQSDFRGIGNRQGKFHLVDFDVDDSRFQHKKNTRSINDQRIEAVVMLAPSEYQLAGAYIRSAAANQDRVLGKGLNIEGPAPSDFHRKTDDNLPVEGCHNCATWFSTAPIGENGQTLFELLGLKLEQSTHNRVHKWIPFLLGAAPTDRVPLILYWTPDPLENVTNEIGTKGFTWKIQDTEPSSQYIIN